MQPKSIDENKRRRTKKRNEMKIKHNENLKKKERQKKNGRETERNTIISVLTANSAIDTSFVVKMCLAH